MEGRSWVSIEFIYPGVNQHFTADAFNTDDPEK